MKIIFRQLVSCFIVIFFMISSVQATSVAAEFASFLNAMHTMKADFIQITYDNHNKPIQQSYGRMALRRPGQFRWQVVTPIPQLMIANESRLWVYDEDLEQVTIRPLKQVVGETPGLLLSHIDRSVENDFTITLLDKSSKDQQWFLLVPKKSDSMFAAIQFGFINGHIQEMRLADHLGHTTLIVFKKIQFNNMLPSSLFVLKPPAHVDVIDETK